MLFSVLPVSSVRPSVPLFDCSHHVPHGGFAAECRAGVSDVEWMKARLTSKASASVAAVAGRSPAVASQN